MSYAKKYETKFATQRNDILTIELWEDGYAGSVITYPCNSFNLQHIPEGDDPFEPIYASQIQCVLDVTENEANMPDFTAMDDRKYWVKVLRGSTVEWQGWALSDDVQFNFSTGIKELQFNAVCGLGMLADIDYTTTNPDYRAIIWQFIYDCLRPLAFPTNPLIRAQISIYSGTMLNRTDAADQDPWGQAYMAINNFIDVQEDDSGVLRNSFSCLDVLRDILTSWGCRIFMANGEWNIVQLNQACEATRYWTRYDMDAALPLVDSGTFTGNVNVGSSAIFVTGEQLKIYKKGFNNFIGFKEIEFAQNLLFNPKLKLRTGNNADYWVETVIGTGYVAIKANQEKGVNAWILTLGNFGTGALAQVESQTPIPIQQGDAPTLQFRLYNTTFSLDSGGALLPHCFIRLVLSTALGSYYLTDNNEWDLFTIGVDDYYAVNDKGNNTLVNLEEIPPVPQSGTLTFGVIVKGSGQNTQSAIIIGDFELSIASEFKSVLMTAKINDTNSYRKEVVFPHGYNIDIPDAGVKPSHLGAITDAEGNQMYSWYNFERFGIDSYFSLAELMFRNYINMLRRNIINIDATIEGNFTARDVLTFADADPSQISVLGSKYMIGNTTFDTQMNECNGTFLQLDNTPQEVTVTTIYDNGVGQGIELAMANGAGLNSGAACAFTTYTLKKYSTQFLPVVGDVIYNDINLTLPFSGGTLWWKFFIVYFNTTRAYRINAFGVITEVSTCA